MGCRASDLGLLGCSKVFASYQKSPLQHPSTLQTSQNFYLWVITNFRVSGVPPFSSSSAHLPYSLREVLEFYNWQKIPVHPDFLRQLSLN